MCYLKSRIYIKVFCGKNYETIYWYVVSVLQKPQK